MITNPRKTAQALFFLNALIWLAFGIATLAGVGARNPAQPGILAVIGALMFGNVAAMLLAGWGIGRGGSLWMLLALAVLGVNILLTFTDQVGLLDWLTLAIDLVILGVLMVKWREITGKPAGGKAQ
jgi:hypothetical protein